VARGLWEITEVVEIRETGLTCPPQIGPMDVNAFRAVSRRGIHPPDLGGRWVCYLRKNRLNFVPKLCPRGIKAVHSVS
jgi:hypothetical protein